MRAEDVRVCMADVFCELASIDWVGRQRADGWVLGERCENGVGGGKKQRVRAWTKADGAAW